MDDKTMETIEYLLPTYWASYLINGDHSGLEAEEKAKVDRFIDTIVERHGHAHFCDVVDQGFCRGSLDCDELAGDYSTYTLLVTNP